MHWLRSLWTHLEAWLAAEARAFRGSWIATPVFYRLAGSKLASGLGLLLGVAAAVCASVASDIVALAPRQGARLCSAVAVLGALVASFGKGLADRRTTPPRAPDAPAAPPPGP
jgi:hypothetical protein